MSKEMSNKDLLDNLIEYVCYSETQDGDLKSCELGVYPKCNEVCLGCYELLRETEKRFTVLDDIEEKIKEVKINE